MRPVCFIVSNADSLAWLARSPLLARVRGRTRVQIALPGGLPDNCAVPDGVELFGFTPASLSRPARALAMLVDRTFMHRVKALSFAWIHEQVAGEPHPRGRFKRLPPMAAEHLALAGLDRRAAKRLERSIQSRIALADPALAAIPDGACVIALPLQPKALAIELAALRLRGCRIIGHLPGWDTLEYAGYLAGTYDAVSCWNAAQARRFEEQYPGRTRAVACGELRFELATAVFFPGNPPPRGEKSRPRILYAGGGQGSRRFDEWALVRLNAQLAALPETERPEIWVKDHPATPVHAGRRASPTLLLPATRETIASHWPASAGADWHYTLIQECDCVIGLGSTLQLEALALGVPVAGLCAPEHDGPDWARRARLLATHQRALYHDGAVPLVEAGTVLTEVLAQARDGFARAHQRMRDIAFAPDGTPSENLLRLMESV